jgi:peroxiredoxin
MTKKISISMVLAALVLSVAASASAQDALAIGAAPPMSDVPMRGVDGRSVSIADVAGARGTLVIFTCNHCPWARAWESRIVELGNAYRERGIGVVAINPNDPAQQADDGYEPMRTRAREAGMRFPYVVDETSGVARAFGATRTPEVFLFDAQRRLVYHGSVDDNAHEPDAVQQRYLRDALEALLAGRPIAQATTRSMGCTIKWRPAAAAGTGAPRQAR